MNGIKEAPLSDRLKQGQDTKENDAFDVYGKYSTFEDFLKGFAAWNTSKPGFELRRSAECL